MPDFRDQLGQVQLPGVGSVDAFMQSLDQALALTQRASDFYRNQSDEARSSHDAGATEQALKGILADAFDVTVPQSRLDVALEATPLDELKVLGAFIPPRVLSKLKDMPVKTIDKIRKVSPEVAEKADKFGLAWLEELLDASTTAPKKSLHGSADVFTGDEIDLGRFAGRGAGGGFQGERVFYSTDGPPVAEGYVQAARARKVKEGEFSMKEYWDDATEQVKQELGDEFVAVQPTIENTDPTEYDDKFRRWLDQRQEISQRAHLLADDDEAIGQVLSFTMQPGTGIIQYDEPFGRGIKRALDSALDDRFTEPVATALKRADSPQRLESMLTEMINRGKTKAELPESKSSAADVLNELVRELGFDALEYPSGQVFGLQGFRNFATNRPEVFRSSPLGEVLIGD